MSATRVSEDVFKQKTADQQNRTENILKAITSIEADLPVKKPTLCPLTNYSIIEIRGPDAVKFMQGQFTCDVAGITPGNHGLGSCCNNKGRMLGVFTIARLAAEHFLLRLPTETAETLINHLTKFKAFFNCSCELNPQWLPFAWFGDASVINSTLENLPDHGPAAVSGQDLLVLTTGDTSSRHEIWLQDSMVKRWLSPLDSILDIASEAIWNLAEIKSGIGEVYASTVGEFIPQMFNLQVLGGISFTKGCYTGQEIVARMQYLGKLKKRLYLLQLSGESADINSSVFDASQKKIGTLVRVESWHSEHQLGLAVLDNQPARQQQQLAVGENGLTRCHIMPLPYQLPAMQNQRPPQK